MMKKLIMLVGLVLVLASAATAQEANNTLSATEIHLGDGQGSIIITGDGNTIYLPPEQETDSMECPDCYPNIFHAATGNLILRETKIESAKGVATIFSRIILNLNDGRCQLVWAEQEEP